LKSEARVAISAQVVDTSVDPLDERRHRRRALLRIGFPIAGVVLLIAAVLAIALYSERANRRDALALSQDLLSTLDDRIALAVSSYLDPATRAVAVARDVVMEGSIMARLPTIETVSASLLRETPQIAILSFADEDGNYVMVRRGAAGGIDTKVIENEPGPRRVTWIRRNANGDETGREEDPSDAFDPRTRPWFTGAAETEGVFWTGVYVFFTDQKPGLTASTRYRGPDGRLHVLGADITLEDLSRFLASLEIGATGRAIIMDGSGKAIATPKGSDVVRKDATGEFITADIHELGDPALTAAYDRFRIEGYGRRVIDADGRRYISAATALSTAGRDWSVLLVVPEDEFVGFVASNNRNALLMSAAVIAIAALLAALLVRQGLRADRTARQLLDRQRAIDRQSGAFATLAADADLFDPAHNEAPRALTETLAEVARARRSSIWRLTEAGRVMRCEDSFERESGGHVDGLELHKGELPQLFSHLLGGEELDVADATADRRTAELERVVMRPLGTRSLFVVPVKRGDRVVGAVALEDAPGTAGARDFVRAVAHMVALRMAEAPTESPAGVRVPSEAAAAPPAETKRSYTAELASRGIDPATIEGDVFSNVAVMVVHLVDPVALSIRLASGESSISDQIACTLQQIARKRDVPYLKIVGQEIIGAAGFDAPDGAAALLIADVALAIRDHCLELFEDSDQRQEFRIGIDCGPAIGTDVGSSPRLFNLWGEAVRSAGHMASTGLPGTVQVTEAAYDRLRHDFLFRPRGAFYLPQVGEARTFILAGRR
jgi:class 3 adenylate cyclase